MNRTIFGLTLAFAFILIPSGADARTPVMCPEYYAPQCGAKQVQCIKAPCNPVYETYSNSCFLNADGATFVHEGECAVADPYRGNDGDGSSGNTGTYVPPGNCSAWYDGCNSCSRSTVNGPAMCTLMACTGDTKPGYCKAYFGNVDPVVTPPDETPIPVDIGGGIGDTPIPAESDGGIGDTPNQGFFVKVWGSVTSWFGDVFSRFFKESDAAVERKAAADLSIDAQLTLSLIKHDGDFYEFAVNDPINGGGIELLAHRVSGKFDRIWEGQDLPPCAAVDTAAVPASLVATCLSGIKPVERK